MKTMSEKKMRQIQGGKTLQIICWGNSRPSTGIRGCSFDVMSGISWVAEAWMGRHLMKTGHSYVKYVYK